LLQRAFCFEDWQAVANSGEGIQCGACVVGLSPEGAEAGDEIEMDDGLTPYYLLYNSKKFNAPSYAINEMQYKEASLCLASYGMK